MPCYGRVSHIRFDGDGGRFLFEPYETIYHCGGGVGAYVGVIGML